MLYAGKTHVPYNNNAETHKLHYHDQAQYNNPVNGRTD
jgi:hypothetical protein